MKYLILLILASISSNVLATKDIYYYKKIGNVKIRVVTLSTSSKNITEAVRIGKLCNSYLKSHGRKVNTIFLDFIYTSDSIDSPKSFIGFNKAKESFLCYGNEKKYEGLEKEGLVLHLIGRAFTEEKVIYLIEYGLDNVQSIKQRQNVIKHGCFEWECVEYNTPR